MEILDSGKQRRDSMKQSSQQERQAPHEECTIALER